MEINQKENRDQGRKVSYCVFLCVVIGTRIIFFSVKQVPVPGHARIGLTCMIMREIEKLDH